MPLTITSSSRFGCLRQRPVSAAGSQRTARPALYLPFDLHRFVADVQQVAPARIGRHAPGSVHPAGARPHSRIPHARIAGIGAQDAAQVHAAHGEQVPGISCDTGIS